MMDFDEAFHWHVRWKMKLWNYMKQPDGSLQADEIQHDHHCLLGEWIYGEGLKYSSSPEFEILKREHKRLHRAAAMVVRYLNDGLPYAEELALGSESDFALASLNIASAIELLKKRGS